MGADKTGVYIKCGYSWASGFEEAAAKGRAHDRQLAMFRDDAGPAPGYDWRYHLPGRDYRCEYDPRHWLSRDESTCTREEWEQAEEGCEDAIYHIESRASVVAKGNGSSGTSLCLGHTSCGGCLGTEAPHRCWSNTQMSCVSHHLRHIIMCS